MSGNVVKKYLVAIKRKSEFSNKFVLDLFYPIKVPFNSNDENCVIPKVADQFAPQLGKELKSVLFGINMRIRYNPKIIGPLLINWTSEGELTAEMFENYINTMDLAQIQQFVKNSKIKL